MGYSAKTDADIDKSIERHDKKRWQRATEAIYVCKEGEVSFDIVLKSDEAKQPIEVFYAPEGKDKFLRLKINFCEKESRQEGRSLYVKLCGIIEDKLAPNYYDLVIKTAKNEYKTVLAVAPLKCFSLDKKGKEKLFGLALQLYSLKSKRNWGIGDFTDLKNTVDILADCGGDVIGLNPLNVLLNDYPEAASPYASVSRLFLNPIYIDVEKVFGYQKSDKDEKNVQAARDKENIDYTAVYRLKIATLKKIYKRILQNKSSAYFKEFSAFKAKDDGSLHRLAVFQAIAHERYLNGGAFDKKTEAALGTALGKGVDKFTHEHAVEIDFFKFLQFEADRQLGAVAKEIKKRGLAIGLYRDLPVGVSKDSAEVWSDKYLYIQHSGAGVPPDSYFPTGQKWGLGAFNPQELKERCYRPFIRILRANMRYAGAVRIDHIMGLSRLFVIPDDGIEGTYIRFNAEDMMNILALESYLNSCVVVGECIGNVEEGYAQSLLDRGIYLLGVLWSERVGTDGCMKKPSEYEDKYFASVGTHDMPPLKAWWFGREIATMHRLGLYDDKEMVDKMLVNIDKDLKVPKELVPICPVCGETMEPNLRKDAYFVEDDLWYKQNNLYNEFVDNSKEKKVVLLEFGCGFNTPGIIRFPFEKMTSENINWKLIRFNKDISTFFGLENRFIGIKEDINEVIK